MSTSNLRRLIVEGGNVIEGLRTEGRRYDCAILSGLVELATRGAEALEAAAAEPAKQRRPRRKKGEQQTLASVADLQGGK